MAELRNPHLPPPSPTLLKASRHQRRQRDLSHYLEEERRQNQQQAPKTARAITPLYAGLAGGNVNVSVTGRLSAASKTTTAAAVPSQTVATKAESSSKDPKYHIYRHPFVLIEEASYLYAPIQKEYIPSSLGKKTFPVLYWESASLHCPFVQPPLPPQPSDGKENLPEKTSIAHAAAVPLANTTNNKTNALNLIAKPKAPATLPIQPPRAKPGYCECCCEKYSDLDKHIMSEYHRRYAVSAENYSSVDQMIVDIRRPPKTKIIAKSLWPEEPSLPSPARSTVSSKSLKDPSFLGKRLRNDQFECPVPPKATNITKVLEEFCNPSRKVRAADPLRALAIVKDEKSLPVTTVLIDADEDDHLMSSPSFKRRRSERIGARMAAGTASLFK